jgi:hypothetical protein
MIQSKVKVISWYKNEKQRKIFSENSIHQLDWSWSSGRISAWCCSNPGSTLGGDKILFLEPLNDLEKFLFFQKQRFYCVSTRTLTLFRKKDAETMFEKKIISLNMT